MEPNLRFHIYDDLQALSRAAASAFVASARRVLSERPRFAVALAGGSTPKTLYRLLASELASAVDWGRVHLFWTDERYVPPDHVDSNYRLVQEALLQPLDFPAGNIHAPDTSSSDPQVAARQYEESIRTFFGEASPHLDFVLLGLGEDGHVASLFPSSPALTESIQLVTAVSDSPKPPPVRLTMTLRLLNAAQELHFLVAGSAKQPAFSKILTQEDANLPAQEIRPTKGTVDWWVDTAAANPKPTRPSES